MDDEAYSIWQKAALCIFGAFVWFGVPFVGLFAILGVEQPVKFGMIVGPIAFALFVIGEEIDERRARRLNQPPTTTRGARHG